MSDVPIIEGTREELQEQLQGFPKEQRFRVIPLPQPTEAGADEQSLAGLFAGRVGRFHFGDANLSQNSSEKFAALIDKKKRKGQL